MGQGNRWQLNRWIASCWLPHFKIAFGISHFNNIRWGSAVLLLQCQDFQLRTVAHLLTPCFEKFPLRLSSGLVNLVEKLVFLSFTYLIGISAGVEITNQFFGCSIWDRTSRCWVMERCEFQIQMIFSSKNSCLSICSHHHHFEVYISQRRCFDLCKMYMMTQNFFEVFNGPYDLVLILFLKEPRIYDHPFSSQLYTWYQNLGSRTQFYCSVCVQPQNTTSGVVSLCERCAS